MALHEVHDAAAVSGRRAKFPAPSVSLDGTGASGAPSPDELGDAMRHVGQVPVRFEYKDRKAQETAGPHRCVPCPGRGSPDR